jgi:hypothetical protein
MNLSELEPGSLAVLNDGSLAIVLEHRMSYPKNPVIFSKANKVGGARYKAPASDFRAVIGLVDLDEYNRQMMNVPGAASSNGTDDPRLVPSVLKGVKIGDMIMLRRRGGPEKVKYMGYKPSRPKYPVSFETMSGRCMKCAVSMVIGKAS